MFRDVPGCFGMFRNVPECSGIFHVPGFIDAPNEDSKLFSESSIAVPPPKLL